MSPAADVAAGHTEQ